MVSEAICNNLNDPCLPEHADLDSMDFNIGKERVYLCPYEWGIDRRNIGHSLCILGSESSDDRASVGSEGAHRLHIRQNTCTPRGVHPGNRERVGDRAR
jgi:hypothetical protein